jgi:cbb3-type cytochrome oxidase subunit 3
MRDLLPLVEFPMRVILSTPMMLLLFVCIVAWVYRKGGQSSYREIEQLPLEDDIFKG